MKYLLFIFTFFQVSLLQAQWRTMFRDADPANNISGASFFSSTGGYVATDKWIGFTSNSGQTFERRVISSENINPGTERLNVISGFTPLSVHAINKDTVITTGSFGNDPAILYSSDNGMHWDLVYHRLDTSAMPSGNAVYKICFPESGQIGFAIQSNEIIKTTDKGRSWHVVFQNDKAGFFTIGFKDDRMGYVAGPNLLLKTTDGGDSWAAIGGVSSTIQAISVIDDQKLAVLTSREDSYFTKLTFNGGNSWLQEQAFPKTPVPVVLNDLHFVDDSVGYTCGTAVYKTRNGGKSWKVMPGSDSGVISGGYLSMFLLNKKQGWVTGPSGLLKRNLGFLQLQPGPNAAVCKDSMYTLRWTSDESGPLAIYYSRDKGEHYVNLASSIAPGDSSYSLKLGRDGIVGDSYTFKIVDEISSLADSATVELAGDTEPGVQIRGNEFAGPRDGEYEFRAVTSNSGGNSVFQWFVNGTAVPGADSIISMKMLRDNDQVQAKLITSVACASPKSAFSNVISVSGITGSNERTAVFPNPAASVINIRSLKLQDNWQTVDVIDAHGQQRIQPQSISNKASVSIQVADLPKGVYFVRLLSQSQQMKCIQFLKL